MAGISKQLSRLYKTTLMMSLKEVRNQLLISHDDGLINDEELLLLLDLIRSDNLDLPYHSYHAFDFDERLVNQMLSSVGDKAAETSKRQCIFFFILIAHWIIFTFTIRNIFTSVTRSKIFNFCCTKCRF